MALAPRHSAEDGVADPFPACRCCVRYESYWSALQSRTAALGANARLTEAEAASLCDAALQSSQDWLRLKAELEQLPRMEAALIQLCDGIGRVSSKLDRVEQSLALCLSNRELHLTTEFTHKKTSQLERQRAQHAKASAALRAQLDSATRAAAASYRQATNIDPPLLHPQPLPNAAVTTAYGTAQLGNITAAAEVRPIQITKFTKAKPPPAAAPSEQKPPPPTPAQPAQPTAVPAADERTSLEAPEGSMLVPVADGVPSASDGHANEGTALLSGGG